MIRRAIKAVVYLTGLLVLAYGYFFVPLGQRTLFDHTRRILATPEAQELGAEVDVAAGRMGQAVHEHLEALQDAGPP